MQSTPCYRMTGFSHWYNLDLPETMAVRERLLPENGAISQIAMSAMDNWGGKISEQNVPVLVVIEGLTMYLSTKDVQQFFAVISRRFEKATVFVETMSPMLLAGFQCREEHSLIEGMAVFAPIYKLLGKLSIVRNISNKIIVLEKM